MSLPSPAEREHLHTRSYDLRGFRRADGLWDIEGHMTDTKAYPFTNEYRGTIPPGEALHDMWLRITIDEDFLVHDIEAVTDAGPFEVCPAIAPNFKKIIGLKIGAGWRQSVRARLGGAEGCTHLVEMLGALATVAFQTLYPILARKHNEQPQSGRPHLLDSCHAFKDGGDIARKFWPHLYSDE